MPSSVVEVSEFVKHNDNKWFNIQSQRALDDLADLGQPPPSLNRLPAADGTGWAF